VPILGEALSIGQIIGGAAVLAGVFIVHRSRSVAPVPLPAALD
jgi:drug/metabolite transporter (DMT)-like permease